MSIFQNVAYSSQQYFQISGVFFSSIMCIFKPKLSEDLFLGLTSIFPIFATPYTPCFLQPCLLDALAFFRRLLRKENRHFFRKENRHLLRKENILLLPIKHLKNKEWIKSVITSELNTNVVHFQMKNEHLHLCQIFIMKYKSNIQSLNYWVGGVATAFTGGLGILGNVLSLLVLCRRSAFIREISQICFLFILL